MSQWTPDESGPVLSDQEKAELVSLSAWGLVRTERDRLVATKAWFIRPNGYVKEITSHLDEISKHGASPSYGEESREVIRTNLALIAALAWRYLEEDLSAESWTP